MVIHLMKRDAENNSKLLTFILLLIVVTLPKYTEITLKVGGRHSRHPAHK